MKKHESSTDKMFADSFQQIEVTKVQLKSSSHGCELLLAALEQRRDGLFENTDIGDAQGAQQAATVATQTRWFFDKGALRQIKIWFNRATYEMARDDMTNRVGVHPVEGSAPYQNGFGATWTDLHADWLTDSIHARLEQKNNPASPELSLTVRSRAEFDAEIKKIQSQPSPLE